MRALVLLGVATAAVVGGVLVFGSGSAKAADGSLETTGVRHGIYHEGCMVFRLEDGEALKSWAMGKKLFLAPWAAKLDEVKEDPEPFAIALCKELFPDCEWPPSDEARIDGMSWESAIVKLKTELGAFELGGDLDMTDEQAAAAGVSIVLSFWRKVIPRPQPKPPMESGGEPPATRALRTVEDFAAFDLGALVEPQPNVSVTPRMVVVGHANKWLGWPDTLIRLESLARAYPELEVVHFSFDDTRRLFGKPTDPIAYLITATDPAGLPVADPYVSDALASMALPPQRLGMLLDHALSGLPVPERATIEFVEHKGTWWVWMAWPVEQGPMQWAVWQGVRGPLELAVASGDAPVKAMARQKATKAILAM
jgi:hypothetical protein